MKITPVSILVPFFVENDHINIWLQARESTDELQGKLEFPGGKVEKGETPEVTCVREVLEEVGVVLEPKEIELFKIYDHKYTQKSVLLNTFLYKDLAFKFNKSGYIQLTDEWVTEHKDQVPPANLAILKDLIELNVKKL